jgi:hypothetical protein
MNDESESMCKEAVVTKCKEVSRNLRGETKENYEKNSVRIAGVWTLDLPATKQES